MPPTHDGLSRRSLLFAGATGAAGLLTAARPAIARPVRGKAEAPSKAKNVIFMVADGMSTGTLTLGHIARKHRDGKPSWWTSLWNKPGVRRSMATTHSADSMVTDSAAGASAWGIGHKVDNGSINIDPTGRQHLAIAPHARQFGKATGLVTTTRITHATPSGFVANAPSRDLEGAIAMQMLERSIEVLMGGGSKHFPEHLLAQYPAYRQVRTAAELRVAMADPATLKAPLLGLFAEEHMPFEIDRRPEKPTLAEMTSAAIKRLAAAPDGFVLQVEGGRVDHAAHSNDAAAIVTDQLAFDDAIGVVWEFAKDRDDTLVIITTDHGNANPGMTIYGQRAEEALTRLLAIKGSYERMEIMVPGRTVASGGPDQALFSAIGELTGIELDADEKRLLAGSRHTPSPQRVAAFVEMNVWTSVLGQILANHTGVSFISPNHTADMVEVTSFGPGSAKIDALIDNTDLHGVMLAALDLPEGKLLPGMDELIAPRKRAGD